MDKELQRQIVKEELRLIYALNNRGLYPTFVSMGSDYFTVNGGYTENDYVLSKEKQLEQLNEE